MSLSWQSAADNGFNSVPTGQGTLENVPGEFEWSCHLLQKRCDSCMLLWDWQLTLTQRRIDHPGDVWQKYVGVLTHKESRHSVQRAGLDWWCISACVHGQKCDTCSL